MAHPLPGVGADHERAHGRRALHVGVIQHHIGALAPQLQEGLLHRGAGCGHDLSPGGGGAGEGHHVHIRVSGEHLAHRVLCRTQDVDHTGGDVGLVGDQMAQGQRRPRGVGRPLQHHGVASGQRRAEFGQVELDREVVSSDGGHHPHGLPLDPPPVEAAVGLNLPKVLGPLVVVHHVGHPLDRGHRGFKLRAAVGEHHRRAHLGHGQLPQLLNMALHGGVELAQAPGPELMVASPFGGVERPTGRSHCGQSVGFGGVGRHAQHLLGGRVHRFEYTAPVSGPQFPVDQ